MLVLVVPWQVHAKPHHEPACNMKDAIVCPADSRPETGLIRLQGKPVRKLARGNIGQHGSAGGAAHPTPTKCTVNCTN